MKIKDKKLNPFHLAISVKDLEKSELFYKNILGCKKGRHTSSWIDLNFFGHQLVLHKVNQNSIPKDYNTNPVDGESVPIPHFGVVLCWNEWQKLADRLKSFEFNFIIDPYVRFKGKKGEQATMFFTDPEGNALEFKSFKDLSMLFES